MIKITQIKLDKKGRLTLPKWFLDANNIMLESNVDVYPIHNKDDCVRINFKIKGEESEKS
tara:strand:- start:592 stop:771 length:180 start_codon:yes stop_codon:yes gene_type:complete